MFARLVLLAISSQPPAGLVGVVDEQRLDVVVRTPNATFDWNDTQFRVRGVIDGVPLRAGEPFELTVQVGALEGQPFDGPVTLTLRPVQHTIDRAVDFKAPPIERHDVGEAATVARSPGGSWRHQFTPRVSGPHVLQVAFRGARYTALTGAVEVESAGVPPWLGPLAALLVLAVALTAGGVMVLRGERRE